MSESQPRSNTPLIIAIVVIVVLLLCCCLAVAGLLLTGALAVPWSTVTSARVEATEKIEKTFEVSAPTTLSVNVNVGDVSIQTGDGAEVRIYAVKHAWGRDRQQAQEYLDDFEIQISQPGTGEVSIEAETPRKLRTIGRAPSVDLEITVPRKTDLDLTTNVGKIEVTGVQGTFDIRANVGDVTLRDVYFEGDSLVRSDVGNLELRLPADSAFAFSAESNVGDVRVDFDVQNRRAEEKVVGESIEGEIGASPAVYVELKSNTGNIRIRKRD